MGKDLKGSGRGLINLLFRHVPGGNTKNVQNVSLACVPTEIRTRQFK